MITMTKTAVRGVETVSLNHTLAAIASYGERNPVAASENEDLLDSVPETDVVDLRSAGQVKFMEDLVQRITALDPATGAQAREYTDRMTAHGAWTAGREGNASAWISRMIAKEVELKKTTPIIVGPVPGVDPLAISPGRYAITDGEVKCYALDYGKPGTQWEGFTFLSRISSDDRFPIRNTAERARILAEIAKDVNAAAVLAALTLRQCRRCGRTLSDTKNPYFEMGMGPECGRK